MERTGKSITVKTWFANKVAQELKRNINMCDVFGILKETEKAYYAVLNVGCHSSKTMWIPKSVVIENEKSDYHETMRFDSYDEAIEEFRRYWKDFD